MIYEQIKDKLIKIKLIRNIFFNQLIDKMQKQTAFSFKNQQCNICFLSRTSTSNYLTMQLQTCLESSIYASYSPLLTLSSFILFHHDSISPPGFTCGDWPKNGNVDKEYPNKQLTVNQLFQPWNQYLSSLVQQNKVYQQAQTMYFADVVSQKFLQNFKSSNLFTLKEQNAQAIDQLLKKCRYAKLIQRVFNLQAKQTIKHKQMAVICLGSSTLFSNPYLPRVHMPSLLYGLYYSQEYNFSKFNILLSQIPTQQQLCQLDGLILTGSSYSVYQHIPQIDLFIERLKNGYKKNQKLKVLGFCFGHQLIAQAFAGQVQSMGKLVTKLERIQIYWNQIRSLSLNYFQVDKFNFEPNEQLLVNQFHGDQVTSLPDNFHIIASSKSCSNEAMVSNDKRVLSFQFHMQYTPQYAGAYQLRLKQYTPKCDYGQIYDESSKIQSSKQSLKSILYLRAVSKQFLAQQL